MPSIFRDIFDIVLGADVGKITDTLSSLNNGGRIKSISSMASRSIFYFPMFVSDDITSDEVDMLQKNAEAQYAIMLAECFSQVPAIEVRPDDMNQIVNFLDKFHQNVGSEVVGSGESARRFALATSRAVSGLQGLKSMGLIESTISSQWDKCREFDNSIPIKLNANYMPINDMYNENSIDDITEAFVNKTVSEDAELETWGFIGYDAPDSIFESSEVISTKEAYSILANKLDSIPDNKIKSAKNISALRELESSLKSMKTKYKKYLVRYKKKYEKSDGKKLNIKFEGHTIENPKQFMKVYGEFIKVVNSKLKLCEERRQELQNQHAKSVAESYMPINIYEKLEYCSIDKLDEMSLACAKEVLENVETSYSELENLDEAKGSGKPNQSQTSPKKYTVKRKPSDIRVRPQANVGGSVFTSSDLKKLNDALPTIITVSVKMAVKNTSQVVDYSFPVGIKVHVYSVNSNEMATNIKDAMKTGRKLLSFIRYTSGEESSMMDLLFGLSKIKNGSNDSRDKNSPYRVYREALQRRKRLSKMRIPFITSNYTLNGSMVFSTNVAEMVKRDLNIEIDSPENLKKLMLEEYLFAVYITDSATESVKIFYDNDLAYNVVSYKQLQRQSKQDDQLKKEIMAAIGNASL